MQATIKDIARTLGIAPSTVSRALRGQPEVSEATRAAVWETARKLHYRPNAIAQSLVQHKTNLLGIVVPEISQPFYAEAISGIEEVAAQNGYQVLICQSGESYEKELALVSALNTHLTDGFIICPSGSTEDFSHIAQLCEEGIPLVLFDRTLDLPVGKVVSDDEEGAFQATAHLLAQGYRRIAHIAAPRQLSVSRNRANGYLKALASQQIPSDPELLVFYGLNKPDMIPCAQKLLALPNPPDAIFCVNDLVAIRTLQVARDMGIRVPQDLGIAGFDNQEASAFTFPPITTVVQPAQAMGRKAASLLLEQIRGAGNPPPPKTFSFKTTLVCRGSTQR